MKKVSRRGILQGLIVCSTVFAAACLFGGLGIKLKAEAARYLLKSSWEKSCTTGVVCRPWPWFDSYPVGRLQVKRLGVDLIVLEGDSGAILAFGPGRNPSGAEIADKTGHCILSGHRDTSFAFLRDMKAGDIITLHDIKGRKTEYQVEGCKVFSSNQLYLVNEGNLLSLVTCFPLDGVVPGTDQRFVVTSKAVSTIERSGTGLRSRSDTSSI